MTFNYTDTVIHYPLLAAPDIDCYLLSLPAPAHHYLDLQLDSGHGGVEKDLHQIAYYMLDWEEKLSSHLELTAVDISDIKEMQPSKPGLQR